MIEVIQDPALAKLKIIQHGFFTRLGGISTGCYKSLNCASASADSFENVIENKRRALNYFDLSLNLLATVNNIHSNRALIVEQPWLEEQKPQADAMVTNQARIILASDSADCPIILFADNISNVIGLAHAGWRGAKNGIIEATIKKMISLGAKHQNISAAISPCIAQDSYEVDLEFYQCFLSDSLNNRYYFKSSSNTNHFLFDLLAYVKNRLSQLNLKYVSSEVSFDTYKNEEKFFSCRRAKHTGDKDFGGHLSCIYINS